MSRFALSDDNTWLAAAMTLGAYTKAERDRAVGKLMRFAGREEFARDWAVAIPMFCGAPLAHVSEREFSELLRSDTVNGACTTWFMFDFEGERGRTLLETFLERHGNALPAGERTYLELMRSSHVRLYEIVRVHPDKGFDLRDLVSDNVSFVSERAATTQLTRWEIIAARIVAGPDRVPVIEFISCVFPPSDKEDLKRLLRDARRDLTSGPLGGDETAFFKRAAALLQRVWVERVAFPPMPTLTTADGEPLAFVKATFDVRDRTRLEAALRAAPDIEADDAGMYVWIDRDQDQRVLGTFTLTRERLSFEAMAEARAERARAYIQQIAGDAVRYRATRGGDTRHALEELTQRSGNTPARAARRKRKRDRESDMPPEMEAGLIAEYLDAHYREWIDHRLPVLGDRTPRHAARLKTTRPTVIALLKTMEHRAERDRQAGRPAYDVGWMWAELGLEREGGDT